MSCCRLRGQGGAGSTAHRSFAVQIHRVPPEFGELKPGSMDPDGKNYFKLLGPSPIASARQLPECIIEAVFSKRFAEDGAGRSNVIWNSWEYDGAAEPYKVEAGFTSFGNE